MICLCLLCICDQRTYVFVSYRRCGTAVYVKSSEYFLFVSGVLVFISGVVLTTKTIAATVIFSLF